MYIVRWLMGHPILATWFLGAIAILLSIGNSGGNKESHGDDHAKKIEHVVSADSTKSLEQPSVVTSALIESDEKKITTEESVATEVKIEAVKVVETKSEEKVKEELSSSSHENEDTQENTVDSEEVVTTTTVDSTEVTSRSYPKGLGVATEVVEKADVVAVVPAAVETQPQSEEEKDVAVKSVADTENQEVAVAATNEAAVTIEETPKPVSEPADAASIQDLGQSSTEEMLLMAREAYWNNGLDEASQIYTQLIELEPKVIEHRGELGNVYWRQGYPKKAAELYSEIAIPMIEQGNSERVANMIGFIGLFYPDRAAEIHKRLQAATQ